MAGKIRGPLGVREINKLGSPISPALLRFPRSLHVIGPPKSAPHCRVLFEKQGVNGEGEFCSFELLPIER